MLVLTFILAIISQGCTESIRFFESKNTFAEYRPWDLVKRGNIRFEFKTYKTNALLLYCDGGQGSRDFLKIQLVNQKLVIQANYGNHRNVFGIDDRQLSDGKFHTVLVKVTPEAITAFLDGRYTQEALIDKSFETDTIHLKSMTYVGGISMYTTGLVEQYMANEPRFTGCIRNLKFTRSDGITWGNPALKNHEGVGNCTESSCDRTTVVNTCINGGLCEAHEEGFSCLCEGTGYTGDKCTVAATVARFEASQYIKYRPEVVTSHNKYDSLSFRLKTRRSNGVIFYYKSDSFFMSVEVIKNYMSVNVGFGDRQQIIELNDKFIADDEWHAVHIGRYEGFITLEVDGETSQVNLENPVPVLYDKDIYIGGGSNLGLFHGVRSKLNFVGCLQQVVFNKKQMLKEAKSKVSGYTISGNLEWHCSQISYVPVMFGSDGAMLKLDPWKVTRSLNLHFKTTNQDGVMVFTGQESEYFVIELDAGTIKFTALKNGEETVVTAGEGLSDGKWHTLTAIYNKTSIGLLVYGDIGDSIKRFSNFRTPVEFFFKTPLILGMGQAGKPSLRPGYRGCMRALSIESELKHLYTYLAYQPPGVVAGCSSLAEACSVKPCYHGGLCNQQMNSYICNCKGTGYEGTSCTTESPSLTFSGSQYLKFLSKTSAREKDTASVRFRTQEKDGLVMFVTRDNSYTNYFYLEILKGYLHVYTNFGQSKLQKLDLYVSDGRWHYATFTRENNKITCKVDNTVVRYYIVGDVSFQYKYVYLGSGDDLQGRSVMRLTKSGKAFNGCLQQAYINDDELIASYAVATITSNARSGCRFTESEDEQVAGFVRQASLLLPPWTWSNTSSTFLQFQFRTLESSGILLYHGDVNGDLIVIQLVDGVVKFHLAIDSEASDLTSFVMDVNDNSWHTVRVGQDGENTFTLTVDGVDMPVPTNSGFDFKGGMYLGNVPDMVNRSSLPDEVQSTPGFIGCIKALVVNNVTQDLLQAGHDSEEVKGQCENTCAAYPCMNGGTCRQIDTAFSCRCSGTFFKGKTCNEEVTKVKFIRGGSMTYSVYEGTKTIKDELHLKFKTKTDNGGLVMIETSDPNQFIKIIIINQYLEMSIKMGGKKIVITSDRKVNDDTSHTISMWRRGDEITYSIDNRAVKSQRLGVAGRVEFGIIMSILMSFTVNNKQFSGCLLGLDYNGLTPLEETDLPIVTIYPGVIVGKCDDTDSTDDTDEGNNTEGDDENNDTEHETRDPANPTDSPSNNITDTQTHTGKNTGLALPFILCIAIGGFVCILVITYGVSRFARRRQGVYKTNEDKRVPERLHYDKLSTIHDEQFELPTKREIYM